MGEIVSHNTFRAFERRREALKRATAPLSPEQHRFVGELLISPALNRLFEKDHSARVYELEMDDDVIAVKPEEHGFAMPGGALNVNELLAALNYDTWDILIDLRQGEDPHLTSLGGRALVEAATFELSSFRHTLLASYNAGSPSPRFRPGA
jgi:hypothetical protein